MKYNRILFVIPKVEASYSASLNPHLGVAYLMAQLMEQDVDVDVFDFGLGYNFQDFLLKCKEFDPEMIGVTLFSYGFVESYKFLF